MLGVDLFLKGILLFGQFFWRELVILREKSDLLLHIRSVVYTESELFMDMILPVCDKLYESFLLYLYNSFCMCSMLYMLCHALMSR